MVSRKLLLLWEPHRPAWCVPRHATPHPPPPASARPGVQFFFAVRTSLNARNPTVLTCLRGAMAAAAFNSTPNFLQWSDAFTAMGARAHGH